MVPQRGRYTNQSLPIPISYNPFILNKKEPQKPSPKGKIDWYAKALEYQKLLNKGIAKNKAEIARIEGVSRARITQIMKLLKRH